MTETKLYYIRSPDSDPHNFSQKRFIVTISGKWIDGNNQASDQWDKWEQQHENFDEACIRLIDEYEFYTINGDEMEVFPGIYVSRVTDGADELID